METQVKMRDIIDKIFDEWTNNLSQEESRIKIFDQIRNIPFVILPGLFNFENGPREMLAKNKGFCVPKHYLLGMFYQKLHLPVQYCTYSFKWNEMEVDYPQDLKKIADALPVVYHLACRTFIGDKWILVDATWDPALKETGFPVNEKWDGRSDTVNAVKPLEEFIHENAYDREKVFRKKLRMYSLSEKLALSRFSGKFNKWLEDIRNERGKK